MKLRTRLAATAVVSIVVILANVPHLWILTSLHDQVVEERTLLWAVAQRSIELEQQVASLSEWSASDDAWGGRLSDASSAVLEAVDSLRGSSIDGELVDSLRQAVEPQLRAMAASAAELAKPRTERLATPPRESVVLGLATSTNSIVSSVAQTMVDVERAFVARQDRLATAMYVVAALAVAAIVAMTTTIGRRISVGIERLSRFADSLGRGDLTYRSHLHGPDEVGELGELLDSMAEHVQESLDDIELFSRAVEQSPVAVIVTDLDGVIEFVNPRFSEMTGYTIEEAVGRTPRILNSGYHSREFYETLWTTILAGETWYGELVNQKSTGETYWQQTTLAPIHGVSGEPTHFIAIAEDITVLKESNTELTRRIDALAETRRAMLNMMEDLEDARAGAEAATVAKSEFLAAMSHEIRTPINAILGMHHLLSKTKLSRRQAGYIDKLFRSSQALLGVVDGILDFSKIEANQLEVESVEFNLNDVLDTLGTLTASRAQEKGLELIIDMHEGVPINLVGDSLRLGQILLNLTSNAIKFTEHGEVMVTVKAQSSEPHRVVLQFLIKDTGIGIGSEQVARLFHPFAQADTSTSRHYGGTGLGLSISKGLVELMGGSIWVESEPGSGSTFHFTVRLESASQDQRRYHLPSDELRGLPTLLLESHDTVRDVLTRYLESFSFVVTGRDASANSIDLLVDSESEGQFGLVIVDSRVLSKLRFDVAEWLTRYSAKIPTLITVHAGEVEVVTRSIDSLGSEHLLTKPILQPALFNHSMLALGYPPIDFTPAGPRAIARDDVAETVRGARILLAEDNEINQQVARELLEDLGFWVTIAGDGIQAIDAVTSSPPDRQFDAVLMDLHMPRLDGYEAARRIREVGDMRALPIIAMTADAFSGIDERVRDAGMDDCVTKPIDPTALYDVLARWIKPGAREEFWSVEQASDNDASPTLPAIRGVNVQEALQRVANNATLLRRLLRSFPDDFGTFDEEINAAFEREDTSHARRLSHTLKGVAGNVGAEFLYTQAETLDALLAADQPNRAAVRKQIDNVSSALGDLIAAIDDHRTELGQETVPGSPESDEEPDPVAVSRCIEHLADAIERSESSAFDHAQTLAQYTAGSPVDVEVASLIGCLEHFDFDGAKEALDTIRRALEK